MVNPVVALVICTETPSRYSHTPLPLSTEGSGTPVSCHVVKIPFCARLESAS